MKALLSIKEREDCRELLFTISADYCQFFVKKKEKEGSAAH